jgi:zinc protease
VIPHRLNLLWLAVLLVAFHSGLPPALAGAKEGVSEALLSNGMKVILQENHRAPIVSFQVWYRAGSRNEQWGRTGLAHLLEHMMFKGTATVPGSEFSRRVQENGAEFNAFTASDYAAYFETLSSDRIQIAIELESDRMKNLKLTEEDFRKERMVVTEERRMRTEDNPQAYLMEQLDATAYVTQPYHWPPVGWIDDIGRLTVDDARAFYRTYYNPANAFIVVVGDATMEDLLPRLEKTFGAIPRETVPEPLHFEDPPQSGERRIEVARPAQLASLIMAYHVPNVRSEDSYVLEVISSVLGAAKSSRLYERLITEGKLAVEADADYSHLSFDPGLFYISASVMPDKTAREVEEAIVAELERLKNEPVGAEELEKAKNQLEAGFVFQRDSLFVQGMMLARYEIASSWKELARYVPSVRRVTAEDIQRVARRYFTPRNLTAGTLVPDAGEGGAPPPVGSAIRDKVVQLRDDGAARTEVLRPGGPLPGTAAVQ